MSKPLISPTARITLGLTGLCASMLFIAGTLGLVGNQGERLESRKQFAESMAVTFSTLAPRTDKRALQKHFDAVLERHEDLVSVGIRKSNSQLIVHAGDHPKQLDSINDKALAESRFSVPVFNGNEEWGQLECHFQPPRFTGKMAIFDQPVFRLAGFLLATCVPLIYAYLRHVLRQLNPSKAVPKRVREALDSLAEGLIVVDNSGKIVMANRAFQKVAGLPFVQLVGKAASDLPFRVKANQELPWISTLENGKSQRGCILEMEDDDRIQTFSVSCAPVTADDGSQRGAMISLENVTELENQRLQLGRMVETLKASGEKITRQNRELEILATRDPLTGCLNRRSFFTFFDAAWSDAIENGLPLSAMMVDIDHFKSVNDNHGHAMGDEVLKAVGELLRSVARETDIVSRYGGEEFSIVMPHTTIEAAEEIAEHIRIEMSKLKFDDLQITASLGVSSLSESPLDSHAMLEQADKCLYFAKRNGRNQSVRHDQLPEDFAVRQEENREEDRAAEESTTIIPFRAVSALISALAFRDQETASHSRRVADLCVLIGEGLVSMRDCYLLEIAGLLHDIGKIGVPDAILLKPGALTDEEWRVMARHGRIGTEIVKRSFDSPQLNAIISGYRLPYENPDPTKTSGSKIPVGARILAISDAYDAMTSDRVFRDGISHEEAIEKMRTDTRFDPRLIDRLADRLSDRRMQNRRNAAIVSKDAALSIGLQLESLSEAIDNHDSQGVAAMARRLGGTAAKHGVSNVAVKANELAKKTELNMDEEELIASASELLDMCRSTQSALLDASLDTKFIDAKSDTHFFPTPN